MNHLHKNFTQEEAMDIMLTFLMHTITNGDIDYSETDKANFFYFVRLIFDSYKGKEVKHG